MPRPAAHPRTQADRFDAYLDAVAAVTGHADRIDPLKAYCTGLLLPGERKSVEPMAARVAPGQVRRMHQSLHHFVADAPWDDAEVLRQVRRRVLPAMTRETPVVAWVLDDVGLPKKGRHSVGVARQDCARLGRRENCRLQSRLSVASRGPTGPEAGKNCRVAVSLSVSTSRASLPIAWRLYLPHAWTDDRERRRKTGIPETVRFQTKTRIALAQVRLAVQEQVPAGPVLAGVACGDDVSFRQALTDLGLAYLVEVSSSIAVSNAGERPATSLRRSVMPRSLSVKALAAALPVSAWKTVTWRAGSRETQRSRFAAVRVRPARRDSGRSTPHPPHSKEWLLIEWPAGAPEPTAYWLGTVAATRSLRELVRLAKHREIVDRDHDELIREIGIGHYEGRGWRGFHHHATLCIAAYGFLVAERSRSSRASRAVRVGALDLATPVLPANFRPRGRPRTGRRS